MGGAPTNRAEPFRVAVLGLNEAQSHIFTIADIAGVRGYVNMLPWKLGNKLTCIMKGFLSIGLFVHRSYFCRCYCVGLIVVGLVA